MDQLRHITEHSSHLKLDFRKRYIENVCVQMSRKIQEEIECPEAQKVGKRLKSYLFHQAKAQIDASTLDASNLQIEFEIESQEGSVNLT